MEKQSLLTVIGECLPLPLIIFLTQVVASAAVISSCDQPGLEAALAAGGTFTFGCDSTITLTKTLNVTKDITLDGNGHSITISGNNAVRIFEVSPNANLTLANLAISDGKYLGANGAPGNPGTLGSAGGILNAGGTVALLHCVLSNNIAVGGNGAGGNSPQAGGRATGGAILNNGGSLKLLNCLLVANRAEGGLGGPFTGIGGFPGTSGDAFGGAIHNNSGTLYLTNTEFTSNISTGGMAVGNVLAAYGPAGNGFGGAIYGNGGTIFLVNSSIASNKSAGGSTGYTSPAVGKGFGGALACSNTTLICHQTSFDNNTAIAGLGVRHSKAGNGFGGALWLDGFASLKNCSLRENLATSLPCGDVGGNGLGGAIFVSAGHLGISESLLVGNRAQGGIGASVAGFFAQGGIGMGGVFYARGDIGITNCTFYRNTALGSYGGFGFSGGPGGVGTNGAGGALFNDSGTISLVNVTLSQNGAIGYKGSSSGLSLGGGIFSTNGSVILLNTILAHSTSGSNCFGTIVDGGYNLSSDSSCNFSNTGSLNNTDPLFGPFQDNGGPTLTLGLTDCSPALNAASPTTYPAVDQRGVARPIGSRSDMGACEGIFTWYHTLLSFTNNAVQVTPIGKPNQPFTLSTSTDLQTWTPVLTNILGANCRFNYSTTNQPYSFFKVVYQ
ncbi:MAG: filamentous hemagglutinin family N-terminal domain protein [Verrucomicrobiales bacterium]|nr:filamentous hemagglutinin family N-terminal domain protein [Verrucomicrobiales bacterium]